MKLRISELTGATLDWAVCKAQGIDYVERFCVDAAGQEHGATNPSTDWAQGGPIVERELIELSVSADTLDGMWVAKSPEWHAPASAPTPLIAAMRCFVASRLGDEVDIPEEIFEGESE